jgi:hypothetical protein
VDQSGDVGSTLDLGGCEPRAIIVQGDAEGVLAGAERAECVVQYGSLERLIPCGRRQGGVDPRNPGCSEDFTDPAAVPRSG